MSPREILSRNLKALMASRASLDTLKKIVAASNGRLSNGKLDRVRRAVAATDIDTLAEIAYTFKVEPWELINPYFVVPDDAAGKARSAAVLARTVVPDSRDSALTQAHKKG